MFDGFKILFVEDDPAVRSSVAETLELAGFAVASFESAERALPHIVPGFAGIVISDVRLPRMDGFGLLERVGAIDATIPMIMVTGHGDVSMAVQAMRLGAYDFIEKPFAMERLVTVAGRAMEKSALRIEVDTLRRQLQHQAGIEATLLGNSPAMREVRRQIINLADTSADVLVFGETGTGKEVVARCLHDHSVRRQANFVAINCGGLPENLFESEIFGHVAGAFTNASKRRIGKIEHAHGGTLLLDEIESMPMGFQVKLLRALQERKIERLGSNEQVPVDIRIVAATKCDLKELSAQQKFRADLYYRLNVATLLLPPLRDRREDIPMLFEQFLLQAAARYGRAVPALQADTVRALMARDWPGNVRELRNAADRYVLGLPGAQDDAAAPPATLAQQMDMIEKSLIEQALRQHQGRPLPVCDALGIGKKTLYDKLHRHGIAIDEYRPAAGEA
ncbi:sigma-54-dependent transcriptional regulator [Pseudoduganella namucuonensis]|uniref:Two-component system, NtrC family, C4-dicarboxylate transport response regulator DctD n=1 Tax=Pseudoduganella namucuonensis TaxID=1035707 RepID=A0A1I7LN13_9BURK|nr:sigma-54 dependent transcriptional regulator [Pseudoduganella namucuonensis]SFV11106.1 two-component system, NtrC family, C4-dicarboxylate transport response regulator DctD [Pseudoduganella namucuonensis]